MNLPCSSHITRHKSIQQIKPSQTEPKASQTMFALFAMLIPISVEAMACGGSEFNFVIPNQTEQNQNQANQINPKHLIAKETKPNHSKSMFALFAMLIPISVQAMACGGSE